MIFLSKIAQIYANLPELSRTTFIFPNRRAGLFFKRELLKYSNNVIFSPCVTDINSFTQSQSTLRKANDIQLLLILYQSYVHVRTNHTDKIESLDAFIPFGLNLFVLDDKHLVHHQDCLIVFVFLVPIVEPVFVRLFHVFEPF